MKNIKRLPGYWMPVFTLLTLLFYVSTFPITAVNAAFDPTPALDPTLDEQSLPNVMLDQANPADSGGQSLARAVGCSQTDLIAAIDAANSSPGESVIELPPDCILQVSTVDNVDRKFMYNGFPVITSKITINGNGARFTAGRTDVRAFQVAAGGELILNAVEMDGFNINVEGSCIVNLGKLQVNQSSLYNNQGRKGGAIYNEGEALFVNSTLANNYSCCCRDYAYGGAIYNSGTLELVNSTLSNNRATVEGQSLYNLGGNILLKNTIITTIYRGDNCAGAPTTDGGGNLRWPSTDTSCVGTHGDPKLASLGDNGGLTKTMALLPGSKAIDTADNAICAANPVNNQSQNGVTRPFGLKCDIGAFELDYLVVASITRRDPNPTNAESVSFAVTFSRSVTGVDLSDFVLTTTGIDNATLISVSGSGADYIVSVDTGTKSGTLRLDVIDDDSIKDSLGHPLGTEGKGNGNFSAGEVYTIDREPPLVASITRVNTNPTPASNVAFLVTFSEPVIGIGASDFLLVPGGLTDALILSIFTESEVSYTVIVSTGVGNGTLRLDLVDNDNITDLAGNPLGGPGPNNGNFTMGEVYTIIKSPTFSDVPMAHWAVMWIEQIYVSGITEGCKSDPPSYCPDQSVTRGQMAIFLLKGKYGSDYKPPSVGETSGFKDVPTSHPFAGWIKQLALEEITSGCGGGNFCPDAPVTREQMAVFLLRGMYGSDYQPPDVEESTGFPDVPVINNIFAAWIKQLVAEGITAGCGDGNYCPANPVTRAQMAVFLVKTFILP